MTSNAVDLLLFYGMLDALALQGVASANICNWTKSDTEVEITSGARLARYQDGETVDSCKKGCESYPICVGIMIQKERCTQWDIIRDTNPLKNSSVYYCERLIKSNYYLRPEQKRPKEVERCQDATVNDSCLINIEPQPEHPIVLTKDGVKFVSGVDKTQRSSPVLRGYKQYSIALRYRISARDNLKTLLCTAKDSEGQTIEIFRQKILVQGILQQPSITGPSSAVAGIKQTWSCRVPGSSQEAPKVTWKFGNGTHIQSSWYSQTVKQDVDKYKIPRFYVTSTLNLTLNNCDSRLSLQCIAEGRKNCKDTLKFSLLANHEVFTKCTPLKKGEAESESTAGNEDNNINDKDSDKDKGNETDKDNEKDKANGNKTNDDKDNDKDKANDNDKVDVKEKVIDNAKANNIDKNNSKGQAKSTAETKKSHTKAGEKSQSQESDSSDNTTYYIVGGVLGGVILVAVAVGAAYTYRRRSTGNAQKEVKPDEGAVEGPMDDSSEPSVSTSQVSELNQSVTTEQEMDAMIGETSATMSTTSELEGIQKAS